MSRELYLKIDDDLSRTTAKLKRIDGSDLTLVFPKGSMMLSNIASLMSLRKQAVALGKNISILTNDVNGQQRAVEAGIPLATFGRPAPLAPARATVPVNVIPAKPAYKVEPVMQPTPEPMPVWEPKPIEPIVPVYAPVVPNYEPIVVKKTKAGSGSHFKKIRHSKAAAWTAVTLLTVVLAALVLLVFVPRATVTIYAHTQPVNRELQLTVDKAVTAADTKNLIIPGQILDKDQQQNKTYTTSGKQNVGTVATGSVQIYNYTGKILKLNAGTTTLTVGTNVYHLQADVSGIKPTKNIPGTNNPDPSSLIPEVAIRADQAGDSYNVPAGTRFEIHNQVLGDATNTLYANTTKAIDSGASKFTAVVSQEDLDKAGADIKNTTIDAAKQQLLNKSGLVLIDSGGQYMLGDPVFNAKVGDQTVSFNAQVGGHIKALVFEKKLVENIVAQRINLTLDKNQKLDDSKAQWTYAFKTLDLDKGTGILTVKYTGQLTYVIDPKQIQALASGKTPDSLKDLLESDSRIDGADIDLLPFWAKTLPSLANRIKVVVKTK